MKIKKRLLSLALAATMALGLMSGMSMTALADGDTTYTLTIPSTLTVKNSGWNDAGGISATGTLASGKKLTVTASSANSFKLKSGSNEVGYTLATASTDTTATTSWTFDSLSSTAATKPMGIIVEDYSDKPAGTYTDTVTFTAKVEEPVIKTLTIKKGDSIADSDTTIEYCEGETWADAVARNPDKIAIDAILNPHRIVLPGQTGNDIDLCKDVDDSEHLVLPTDTIVADGNYLWW